MGLTREKLMEILPNRSWGAIKTRAHIMELPYRLDHPLKKARPFKPLTDFKKGYLCAMMDGEGTISITLRRDKRKNRLRIGYHLVLAFCNTNMNILEKCKQFLSGYGTIQNSSKSSCPMLVIGRLNEIRVVLEAIIDGLVAKREQAELVLKSIRKADDGKLMIWSEEFVGIRTKMKELNTGRRRNSITLINKPNP